MPFRHGDVRDVTVQLFLMAVCDIDDVYEGPPPFVVYISLPAWTR